jgi:hypothetical protein
MPVIWIELTCEVEVREGETFALPEALARGVGPGHWIVTIQPADRARLRPGFRDHRAFLSSYAPEDDGLYDDAAAG